MNGLDIADYDFVLPPERIAQSGLEPRDSSKLLSFQRHGKQFEHLIFRDLPGQLERGDLLVLNRTRVIPARLEARKPSGGKLEVLLLREIRKQLWTAYLKPAKRVAIGGVLEFDGAETGSGKRITATVESVLEDGARTLHFSEDIKPHLEQLGAIPFPPYIQTPDTVETRARYQTVFANDPGSVAAPTAGLHFTQSLLEKIHRAGVGIWPVTLHVGAGTFKPVADSIENHVMHSEQYVIPLETSDAINAAKREGRRVIAVGTTVVRTLESAFRSDLEAGLVSNQRLEPGLGETSIFIRPPFEFQVIDGLITNFHLPRSTLLMLVAAFAGFETMRAAYDVALEQEYRFFSLGDAMFIS
jgi:S-adenosylmethionine:tRNA ribosyltransferase-isomerase